MHVNTYICAVCIHVYIDGLVWEGRGSSALALELCLPCTYPSICTYSAVSFRCGQFSSQSLQLTSHSCPMRARYGVSVLLLKLDLRSVAEFEFDLNLNTKQHFSICNLNIGRIRKWSTVKPY